MSMQISFKVKKKNQTSRRTLVNDKNSQHQDIQSQSVPNSRANSSVSNSRLDQQSFKGIQANQKDSIITQSSQPTYTSNPFLYFRLQQYTPKDRVFLSSYYKFLEPRDQKTIVPFIQKSGESSNPKNIHQVYKDQNLYQIHLNEWITLMYSSILSSSFKFLIQKKLSFEQSKIFCSQNLIANILLHIKDYLAAQKQIQYSQDSHQVYEEMDKFLYNNRKIFKKITNKSSIQKKGRMVDYIVKSLNKNLTDMSTYMLNKYPKAKQSTPNKKLREIVKNINNLQNDENDMIIGSSVKFIKKSEQILNIKNTDNKVSIIKTLLESKESSTSKQQKQEPNYVPQIMKLLNYLITLPSKNINQAAKNKVTYFQAFSQMLQRIYRWIQIPDFIMTENYIFDTLVEYFKQIVKIPQQNQEAKQIEKPNQIPNRIIRIQDQIGFANNIQLNNLNSLLQQSFDASDNSISERQLSVDQLSSQQQNQVFQLQPPGLQASKKYISQIQIQNNLQNIKKPSQAQSLPPSSHISHKNSHIKSKTIKSPIKNIKPPAKKQLKWKQKQDNLINEYLSADKNNKFTRKDLEDYRGKVKKSTVFIFGQKINANTPLFTAEEIQNSDFSVKNTAILKILINWANQLKKKILQAKEHILQRSFRFKSHTQNQYIKLSGNQKNQLYLIAKQYSEDIQQFIDQIKQDCLTLQSDLCLQLQSQTENSTIPKIQYIVGKFSSKLQKAASTYQLNYINKLIQILLQIPLKRTQGEISEQQVKSFQKKKQINLVTFKVADILRCKFSTQQFEIIKIYNLLLRINEEYPQFFKIVKIQDRLGTGNNDIVIVAKFFDKILSEILLEIKQSQIQKQKIYDSFNSYIQSVKDSELGPIMQLACIWTRLDQRSKIYLKDKQKNKIVSNKCNFHLCKSNDYSEYHYPFVCSQCSTYYPTLNTVIPNKRCNQCGSFYICSTCFFSHLNQRQKKQLLGFNKDNLQIFIDKFRVWLPEYNYSLPDHGIMVPRITNQIKYYVFQRVLINQCHQFINIFEDQNKTLKIKQLYSLKSEQTQHIANLCNKYIILQWTQKRYVNKTIKAGQNRLKQIMERQQRLEAEKKQKQRQQEIKKRIKQRRKKQQRQWKQRQGLRPIKQQDQQKQKAKQGKTKKSSQNKNLQQKQQKPADQNTQNAQKHIFKIFSHNRPKSRSSRPQSSQSLNSDNESKQKNNIISINNTPSKIHIQKFTKLSEINDTRVCTFKDGQKEYILLLGFYMEISSIKFFIKQESNRKKILQDINNGNQIIFLQQQLIRQQLNFSLDDPIYKKLQKKIYSIQQLYLDQNKLQSIEFLKFFKKLTVLHASSNFIESMAPLANRFDNMTELLLENNKIQCIEGLDNKKKINRLNLGRNRINQIQGLGKLKKLEFLYLNHNMIDDTRGLDHLVELKQLDLSKNQITTIQNLQNLKQLLQLYLSDNKIQYMKGIPSTKLTKLFLSYNLIEQIQSMDAPNLQELDLTKNNIKNIKSLQNLPNLQRLYLRNNKIKKIQNLGYLKKLEYLDLSKNLILQMNQDDFVANKDGLHEVKALNLSFNLIKQVLDKPIKVLSKIQSLNLGNNPIHKQSLQNLSIVRKISSNTHYIGYKPK